uniref:Uncharacterized protein n=1 Tax=Rhizophora mucronata TaxID=61149 RepID=A0A2P2IR82_RHIMU
MMRSYHQIKSIQTCPRMLYLNNKNIFWSQPPYGARNRNCIPP